MAYLNKVVSISSDEKTFIKKFIEELTTADNRITCDTDIDAQFADTTNTPTFTVNVGTGIEIVFTRMSALSSGSAGYKFVTNINGTQQGNQGNINYAQFNYAQTTTAVRSWKFVLATNANSIYLSFGAYGTVMPTSAIYSVGLINDSGFMCGCVSANANAFTSILYGIDENHKNIAYTLANRITYSLENDNIEVIKNKSVLGGNGGKVITYPGLYDCSTVPKLIKFSMNDDEYFSLGEHTIIKI